jgi:hypothetical protein
MTDSIKREIERLLDEPGDPAATGQESEQAPEQGSGRLRSRLTATLSEGLGDASVSSSEAASRDLASVAAFIDGQLTGAERDKFVADLAQHQDFRADLESTAALVRVTEDNQVRVPKHLLAQAGAQFAPAPQTTSQWDPAAFFAGILLPRRRLALALVAALALIVAVPAGLLIRGQSGGGTQPELSGVEEPVKDTSPRKDNSCEDKAKEDKSKADKSKDMAKADTSKSKDLSKDASIDPCDRSTPGRDATKK